MDEDCIIVKVHSPEAGKKSDATEKSSSKKLKQTLLCFKAMDSNLAIPSISNTQPSKKRRLSDASAFSKSAKNAKKANSDATKRKSVGGAVDEGDKEVSSSCEMVGIQTVSEVVVNNIRPGNSSDLLMKFIHTAQQVEVSTTSSKDGEMAVDIMPESENEDEPTSSGESKEWVSQNETRIENKENIPDSDESHQEKKAWSNLVNPGVSSKGLSDTDVVKGASVDEDANQITTVGDDVVKSVVVDKNAVRKTTSEGSAGNCNAVVKKADDCSVVDENADKGTSDVLHGECATVSNDAVKSVIVDSSVDKDFTVEENAGDGTTVDKSAVVGAVVEETAEENMSTDGDADKIVPQISDDAAKKLQSVSSSDDGKVASAESSEMEVEEELDSVQGKSGEQDVDGYHTSQEADSCKFKESPFNKELSSSEDKVVIQDEMSENTMPKVKTKRPKVPFPSTKKQKMEEQEKELNARKKHKEELEQQKKEKKEQKERVRQEVKMQKEKERLEKEKEKEEKKRQKEEERQKKQEQQEEEKKKKEEARLEEKKRKEEEKRRKEEEKQDKEKNSQKEKQLMQNFFIKATKDTNSSVQQNETVQTGPFMPFELKKNMCLAPKSRFDSSTLKDRAANLDLLMASQSSTQLYLDELKKNVTRPGKSGKMWPRQDMLTGDVVLVEAVTASMMKAKLFQFSENYRPAYYGTWRKRSQFISGRRPFAKDTNQLDYEVDSDDEWEEVEPGESLSHSEGEDETEPDAEPEDDEDASFMVPHGYLSEGEGCEDDDDIRTSPEKLKACQLAKARNWDVAINAKQRFEALRPVFIGICWWTPDGNTDLGKLKEYEAVLFEPQPIALPDISCCSSQDENKPFKKEHKMKQKGKEKGIIYIPVPEAAIPDLIRLVHGNEWSIFKVVKEFQEFWRFKNASKDVSKHEVNQEVESAREHKAEDSEENLTLISKRKLDAKIRQMAIYERRPSIFHKKCWYVGSDSLEKYGLTGLPVPNQWKWTTKLPNKSRKNLIKAGNTDGIQEVPVKLNHSGPDSLILPLASSSACASEHDMTEPVTDGGALRMKTEETDKETPIAKQIVKNSVVKKHSVKRLGKTKLTINSSSIQCFITGDAGQSKTSGNTMLKSKSTANDRLTQKAIASALSKNPLIVLKKLKCDAVNNQAVSMPSSSGTVLGIIPSTGHPSLQPSEWPSDGCLDEPKRQNLKEEVDNDNDCIIVGVENKSASSTVPDQGCYSNEDIDAE